MRQRTPRFGLRCQHFLCCSEERYSLVALKLHTGRTHQIRAPAMNRPVSKAACSPQCSLTLGVHMQSVGHPLITDARHPM